jgi:hypothetical protein
MSLDTPLDKEILKNLAESLAIVLNNANMITGTEDDIYDALKNSRLTINSNNDNDNDNDDNNDDDNGDDQYHCESGLSPQVKNYDIASLDGSIDSDAPHKTSQAIYTTITADINLFDEEALVDTIAYSMALYRELHKNLGSIDHSKVKEYWLYRGPRIVLIWMLGIVLLILVHIFYDKESGLLGDLIKSFFLLITALYLLYWRLPDSIDTTCCKSAHDHYVLSKGQLVKPKKNDKV